MSSLSYSNSRNLSYEATKTLATIGEGSLVIKDKDSSDDTTRLNRDTASINKELYSSSLASSVDAGVDMRLFSGQGRNEIEKEYREMNKNMATIAKTLPNENSYNKAEAIFGYTWNFNRLRQSWYFTYK